MIQKDSIQYTLFVALAVSLVCSVVVSAISVSLRDQQQENVRIDKQKSILAAAGLTPADGNIDRTFANIQSWEVDLPTGRLIQVGSLSADEISQTEPLVSNLDIAQIRRLETYSTVYFAGSPEDFDILIVPVRGYGLWSTLYGYLALNSTLDEVVGLEFYQHKETAGLGGEVDNPTWKAQWRGKKIYLSGYYALHVAKGKVPAGSIYADFQVDGLAGATLTSRGVDNLLKFWLGDQGFKPMLERLKNGTPYDN
ncbi:MAG: Na(+)-translocating NADH-quinone reductase subunit C [Gammaproteobacteria bacterium]